MGNDRPKTPVEPKPEPKAEVPQKPEEAPVPAKPTPTKDKAPEERQTGKPEPYAYTIKDKAFGEFTALNTANAWWIDQQKVQHLIDAYKIDANDDEACSYAGITLGQLRYFKELHPDFLQVKHACHQILGLKAKQALAKKVENEPEWYLERRRKEEYSTRTEQTGANGRDLYDGLAQEMRQLGEEIRGSRYDENTKTPTDEENTGNEDANNADAGQDGTGDAPAPATDHEPEASEVPA